MTVKQPYRIRRPITGRASEPGPGPLMDFFGTHDFLIFISSGEDDREIMGEFRFGVGFQVGYSGPKPEHGISYITRSVDQMVALLSDINLGLQWRPFENDPLGYISTGDMTTSEFQYLIDALYTHRQFGEVTILNFRKFRGVWGAIISELCHAGAIRINSSTMGIQLVLPHGIEDWVVASISNAIVSGNMVRLEKTKNAGLTADRIQL